MVATRETRLRSARAFVIGMCLSVTGCTGLEYQPQMVETSVAIVAPVEGAVVSNPVRLEADANDVIGGDIAYLVTWASDLDGALGTGGSVEATLTPGEHQITAHIDDTQGGTDTAEVMIIVE